MTRLLLLLLPSLCVSRRWSAREDTDGGELRLCGTGDVLDSLEPIELADWGLAAISSERGETAFWARSSAGPFRDELAWLTPFIRPELPSIMSDSILLHALVNMASGHDLESNWKREGETYLVSVGKDNKSFTRVCFRGTVGFQKPANDSRDFFLFPRSPAFRFQRWEIAWADK